jgi:hypothetical protein
MIPEVAQVIPEAMARRIAARKRIWAAKEFAYSGRQREDIVKWCAPLFLSTHRFQASHDTIPGFPSSPAELCIRMFERRAREALLAYLFRGDKPTPASKRDRLLRIADAAKLIRDLTKDEPGMWQPIGDWEERARDRAARVEDEFDHPWLRVHDPVRLRLALDFLTFQLFETRRRPGMARNSRAASFLIAAIDPVMEYASDVLAIPQARRLGRGGEKARYIVGLWLDGKFRLD